MLVGVYENGKLQYTGKIGTGFSQKLQKEMMEQFKPLIIKECPFTFVPDINKPSRFRPNPPNATATWLKPKLICEVTYAEMTSDGVMRHPSFEGMREDKNAKEVVIEKEKHMEKIINPQHPKKLKNDKNETAKALNKVMSHQTVIKILQADFCRLPQIPNAKHFLIQKINHKQEI